MAVALHHHHPPLPSSSALTSRLPTTPIFLFYYYFNLTLNRKSCFLFFEPQIFSLVAWIQSDVTFFYFLFLWASLFYFIFLKNHQQRLKMSKCKTGALRSRFSSSPLALNSQALLFLVQLLFLPSVWGGAGEQSLVITKRKKEWEEEEGKKSWN